MEKFCCSTFFWARLDRAVEPRVLELLALLHRALHDPRGEVALQEEAHEVVLEREEELRRGPGSPWREQRPRSWRSMRRDSWRSVPTTNRPPSSRDALAQFDVGAATSHVGGDGDGAALAGAGDDLGLLLVELGVEDGVDDAGRA
jgi:hypothetical protein